MKRLILLLMALILSGCSLTMPIQTNPHLAFQKYWPTDDADRDLISRRQLTFSYAHNLKAMFPAEYPDFQSWVACKADNIRWEIAKRDEMINQRYRRPDAWLGAGTPSYINVAHQERWGYQEKLWEFGRFISYVNQQIPESHKQDRLNPDLPCDANRLTGYKRFVANHTANKYDWSSY